MLKQGSELRGTNMSRLYLHKLKLLTPRHVKTNGNVKKNSDCLDVDQLEEKRNVNGVKTKKK